MFVRSEQTENRGTYINQNEEKTFTLSLLVACRCSPVHFANKTDLMRIHSPFPPVPTGSNRSCTIGPFQAGLSANWTR